VSAERPTTTPELLATLIESTPERVRKRLDRDPTAAANWTWQSTAEVWSVETGGETVTLPLVHVASVEEVRCTCLLTPRCFHVLACLTHLKVAVVETNDETTEPVTSDVAEELVEPDARQRRSARDLIGAMAQMLRVGVANAGVVVQSGLLRTVHQCRAEGLHRLAALGLCVNAGTSECRARATTADPDQLAEDFADALETSWHVINDKAVADFWIGSARRPQFPVRPRKLHGLFAEPIVTRSGFAGAAVYFLGEDDRIYSASDVRPGDVQRARDAYLGGIELGPLVQPAKQLARRLYLGTDLTASRDGRLGRGKSVKVVDQGRSKWHDQPIQSRFGKSIVEQWDAVYENAALPADARPAGWDFVFVAGRILGAFGSELLFLPSTSQFPLRLAIANESDSLFFRENLRMLSHAPGLRLQIVARVNLLEPGLLTPIAIAAHEVDSTNTDEPRLEIPEPLSDRVCLGFDEIERNWLVRALASATVVTTSSVSIARDDPLASLRRRWIAAMLAGFASQRSGNTNTLGSEIATLNRSGFATAAALLDSLVCSDSKSANTEKFLATAVYLRSCRYELAKARTLQNC
jgi:hypothetical protein